MARNKSKILRDQALKIFKSHGGILRTSEAIRAGIHPRIFYELRDTGQIEQRQRGLYTLIDLPDLEDYDFVTVVKKVPESVICLISALYYHRLTVQIPRWIDIAVHQKYKPPFIQHPPVQFHWFSSRVFDSGVEKHNFGGVEIRIYSPEKTIVDCFRLRKKVGNDVAIEGLKRYLESGHINLKLLQEFARESRVSHIIDPYVQVIMHDQS